MIESPFMYAQGPLRYIGLLLSGICHQFPEHSISIGSTQLPLCARCTGTYLGALIGLANFCCRGRCRAAWLPPLKILAALGLLFAFWGVDGLNSYVNYVTGQVVLYAPSNSLRLLAGMGNGLFLSTLIFPMFNFTLWSAPQRQRVLRSWEELVAILLQVAALGGLLLLNGEALLWPVALLNLLGVAVMLTIVNSMIILLLLQREGVARDWRDTILPLGLGLLLALTEVGGMAVLRYLLGSALAASAL